MNRQHHHLRKHEIASETKTQNAKPTSGHLNVPCGLSVARRSVKIRKIRTTREPDRKVRAQKKCRKRATSDRTHTHKHTHTDTHTHTRWMRSYKQKRKKVSFPTSTREKIHRTTNKRGLTERRRKPRPASHPRKCSRQLQRGTKSDTRRSADRRLRAPCHRETLQK